MANSKIKEAVTVGTMANSKMKEIVTVGFMTNSKMIPFPNFSNESR